MISAPLPHGMANLSQVIETLRALGIRRRSRYDGQGQRRQERHSGQASQKFDACESCPAISL
jgi:hypothetical protein